MRVGMGMIATCEGEGNAGHAIELLHGRGQTLPDMDDAASRGFRQIFEIRPVPSGNDHRVSRPYRMDVGKGEHQVVVIDQICLRLAASDLTEYTAFP